MKKKIALILMLLMAVSAVMLTSCGGGAKNGEVKVYGFGDYIDPELIDEFESETGIKVVLDTFDTNEEMYPVIANQSVKYDVICASDYMIQKMNAENLLAEIDYANTPNIENIDGKYLEKAAQFDEGNKHSVPYTYGTLGIIYNTKKIKEGEIKSWNDLWNPKYSQQIVMPDSIRDTFAIALKAKGYSLNTVEEKELAEATKYLTEQKPLVYKYANDSARDLAIGGSADIAVVWSGEVLYSQESNPDLEFVLPEEGSEEFLDMWAIPAAAENKENAEKWIDFMMAKNTALKNFEYLTYAIPNKAVMEKIKDDKKTTSYLFPEVQILSKCEMLKSLGVEADDMYSSYWKEFKAE